MRKLKKQLHKLKRKLIRFIMWIIRECKNWQTILLLLIVATVIQIPTWGGFLLYITLGWQWALAVATVAAIFWAGPFSPFWIVCVTITLGIKRLFRKMLQYKRYDVININKKRD